MARKKKITGLEIKEKAKKGKLERERAFSAKKHGKSFKFTPARIEHIKDISELDEGVFLGEVDTESDKETGGIKPGKYNLFLTGEEDGWQIYAESNGQIVGKADQVKVEIDPTGTRSPDESYIQIVDSPEVVLACIGIGLGIASLVVSIISLFRWW